MTMNEESFEGISPKLGREDPAPSTARGLSPLFPRFVATTEYARFAQMCDACRHSQYSAVCLGPAGVGKTCCARYYAQWDRLEPFLPLPGEGIDSSFSPDSLLPRTAFYTPKAAETPKQIERDLMQLRWGLQRLAERACMLTQEEQSLPVSGRSTVFDLLIVDGGDRLSRQSLEVVWDFFEQSHVGLVVLGLPGWEKRWLNQQALTSRCGALHTLCALGEDEGRHLFEERAQQLGWSVVAGAVDVFWDWTRGNFQLMALILTSLDSFSRRRVPFTVTGEVVKEAAVRLWNERTASFPQNQKKKDDDQSENQEIE